MWVVKLGGSLNGDAALGQWLDLLARLGGGRVTVVCGGGEFADAVRRAQARWRFDDLNAHNMAVLSMAQSAYMAQALNPSLRVAASGDEIRRLMHRGQTALWLPYERLRDKPDASTHWQCSADTLALELARSLNAERMVVVKSCPIDAAADLPQLSAQGVLDRGFASAAGGASFPIDVVHKSELQRVSAMLLGPARSFEGVP